MRGILKNSRPQTRTRKAFICSWIVYGVITVRDGAVGTQQDHTSTPRAHRLVEEAQWPRAFLVVHRALCEAQRRARLSLGRKEVRS